MCEQSFAPYLEQTMKVLIQAGMLTCEEVNASLPVDDQKQIHALRESLIDAFISIINGIKSPGESSLVNLGCLNDHIKNMFFYLEKLITLPDLQINGEVAKQIIDMYSDIVILQMNEIEGSSIGDTRQAQDFCTIVRNSQLHRHIQERLAPFKE